MARACIGQDSRISDLAWLGRRNFGTSREKPEATFARANRLSQNADSVSFWQVRPTNRNVEGGGSTGRPKRLSFPAGVNPGDET